MRYCLGRDFQPAAAAIAYFGELEEALINGATDHHLPGMITSDVQTKCKLPFLRSSSSSSKPYPYTEKDRFLLLATHGDRGGDMPRLLHFLHTVDSASV